MCTGAADRKCTAWPELETAAAACRFGGSGSGGGGFGVVVPPAAAGLQAVAFAVHLEDMDVVGEPVEQGARQALGAEHRRPLVEGQVAGDQGRAALVALARSSLMMVSFLTVTSNVRCGGTLQAPFPALATPRPERP